VRLCGIDEAGRGSLAGSLVMAGVVLHEAIDGLNDSKKLTQRQRERLFETIIQKSDYCIVKFEASQIDAIGLSACLANGLRRIQNTLLECHYLFDGNCRFGVDGIETMVKADTLVAEVSAASIIAKVTRDQEMIAFSKKYSLYGFEKHKGYGTAKHIEAIMKHGRCEIHRKSFRIKGVE